MTVIERYKAIQNIGLDVEVPHEVWTLFGSQQKIISIIGNEVSLGEDYTSIRNARKAIEFYVKQFGGKVKWSDED